MSVNFAAIYRLAAEGDKTASSSAAERHGGVGQRKLRPRVPGDADSQASIE
jgi:hypothetical protein